MRDIVEGLLRKAGWLSGRSRDVAEVRSLLESRGYTVAKPVELFLRAFTGIAITFARDRRPDAIWFDAERPSTLADPIRNACRILRVQLPRAHPRWGIEFDWLGVDRQGHVAVFTTSGYGPVPEGVNQHLADVDAAVDRVRELPVTGSAGDIMRRSAGGDYSHWHAYSAKGFYAYDWQEWHGPYQRLSSPTVAISISQLPAGLRAVAHLAEFPVTFADAPEITVEYVEPPEPDTGHTPKL